jgi:hypothetical protein
MEGYNYAATGLEQDENGAPDFSPKVHQAMSDKRAASCKGP